MQRNLKSLGRERFDVIVVGGGMFGAAAALDAAQCGLRVALIERGDFAGATSAQSPIAGFRQRERAVQQGGACRSRGISSVHRVEGNQSLISHQA